MSENCSPAENNFSDYRAVKVPFAMAKGTWYHIELVYGGSDFSIIVNGNTILETYVDSTEYDWYIFYPKYIQGIMDNIVLHTWFEGEVAVDCPYTAASIEEITIGEANIAALQATAEDVSNLPDDSKALIEGAREFKSLAKEYGFDVDIPSDLPGDVNDDGKVNSKDISLFLKSVAGWDVVLL